MKKFLFSLIFLLSFCGRSSAQYVTIPDTNFVAYLQANYPSAMIGNQMDTTDGSILNAYFLAFSNLSIQNLDGIQYFDALVYLWCPNNLISSLPTLPSMLRELRIDYNQLVTLPALPDSMVYLDCSYNQLTTLPALPTSIKNLWCDSNQLTTLPTLPGSLLQFGCSFNQLTSLPSLPGLISFLNCAFNQLASLPSLPNSLSSLVCRDNLLTTLPTLPPMNQLECSHNLLNLLPVLPNSIITFNCSFNQLTSLPALPVNLWMLGCSNNQLTSLPFLPNSIVQFDCSNNLMTGLPALPSQLKTFNCSGNQLSSLPALPNLQFFSLDCHNNQLTFLPSLPPSLNDLKCYDNGLSELPILPDSLVILDCHNNINLMCLPAIKLVQYVQYVNIDNTLITCIPNHFVVYDTVLSTSGIMNYPLCDPSNGCPFYWNITGNVHKDTSLNCILDDLSPGNRVKNIKLQLLKNGLVQQQIITPSFGEYSFDTGNSDTLSMQVDTTDLPFLVSCPNVGSYGVILTPADSLENDKNFGIKCNGIDAEVRSIVGSFRPAAIRQIRINAGDASKFYNLNCGSFSGTLTTILQGPVSYVSPASGALSPSTVAGNVLTYNIADFSLLNPATSFNIMVQTDTTATPGSPVFVSTKITNVLNDIKPNDDSLKICFLILNSYDPNIKELSPEHAEAGDWLNYTIHFQNTGNDTAFLVVIKDTLSANLDIPSFTYMASSHDAITQVKDNFVTFTFPHINLLDSLNHEPESHGWIQYKIKLKNGLPNGTTTYNKASIYFDFNQPIVTNTATNVIGPVSTSNALSTASPLRIYPNPALGQIVLEHSLKGNVKLTIISLDGREIFSKASISNKEEIDLQNISSGMYLLKVSNEEGERKVEKFLIRR